jgi:peroxidase
VDNQSRRSRRLLPASPFVVALVLAAAQAVAITGGASATQDDTFGTQAIIEAQSLDGSNNNQANPTWGRANRPYSRFAPTRYVDGRSQPFGGPNSRAISNRVFNDVAQNIFSERDVTAWGWTWGQFIDHTIGIRDGAGERADIPFNRSDPLEQFRNDLGVIPFSRSAASPGTGVSNARQQTNLENSYIDAEAVYGTTNARLDWLREGSFDGNPANNGARLLMPNNLLPTKTARGNAPAAPAMDVDGNLLANPTHAMVAGDVRANENLFLTATQTLFAREHNRIVSRLPASLSEEDKFQIARRIVIAEQQYITYNEWLPAMGVNLPAYTGYKTGIDATLSNEFATSGFRAHSMIHGEMEIEAEVGDFTQAQLDAFEAQGLEVTVDGDEVAIVVPLNKGFFNPDLMRDLGVERVIEAIAGEPQYKNEEMIDNQLRSVLFKVPVSGNPDCLDGPTLPECFNGVVDLAAIDIERGRDHGVGTYNQVRQALGLPAKTSFTAITGESSAAFPAGTGIDNPNSQDFTSLVDRFNQQVNRNDEDAMANETRTFTKRAPLAARLSALYGGNVNNVDSFVGIAAEPHVAGSEFGETERAIWAREFSRLRDGDRFFFGNDPGLTTIRNQFGIDFRRNLGDIIADNTGTPRAEIVPNVFFDRGFIPPTACRVTYTITDQWSNGFQTAITIQNTGSRPINNWDLRFTFANGQVISLLWNGVNEQNGLRVPITNASWNNSLAPGQSITDMGFVASWNGVTNARPNRFSLNTTVCSTG